MQNKRPRILAVDDDPAILSLVAQLGASERFDIVTAANGNEALLRARERAADLVLLDLHLPNSNGFEVLTTIRDASPNSRVVIMTGYGSIDTAVQAVKCGASDYLTKPFDLSRLRQLLRDVREAWERSTPDTHAVAVRHEFCGMVGGSPAIKDVFSLIERLAPYVRTTLITGETGTGKELAARALHNLGPRRHRRMVTVNCSAVVETLFESELFGHVRGAFTGATEHKAGLFEAADGGTLFLDEVGELPPGAQAKLLRVLEDGEVQRVGSLESRRVDVRIIAATNRDLRDEVAAGRFRGDLYYRLNVVGIHLPALRDRRDDIVALAQSFVASFGRRLGKPFKGLTLAAESALITAPWSGNVRELRNSIERACILANGETLSAADLAGGMGAESPIEPVERRSGTVVPMPSRSTTRLSDIEREHIVRVLSQVRGNKAVAARLLGVSRRAFYRQLERHGLHHRISAPETDSMAPPGVLERAS